MGQRPRYLIVGGGRLALAWATELVTLNLSCHLHSRSTVNTDLPITITTGPLAEMDRVDADVILLCVIDDALPEVARQLAQNTTSRPEQIYLHCSGLCRSEILRPLKVLRGCAIGSIHPLQSFSLPPTPGKMKRVFFAIEGDKRACEQGLALAAAVGGLGKVIRSEQKVAYHASAVIASNLLVALADAAVETAQLAGFSAEDALQMLLPLIEGSVANLAGVGLPMALTGPISRGDSVVVDQHLTALSQRPKLKEIYSCLSQRALAVSERQGLAHSEQLERIRKVLDDI